MEFLADLNYVRSKPIYILTDCQPVIKTAFGGLLPKCNIETVISIIECLSKICGRGNEVKIHWVPRHKHIRGNDLADLQAKEAVAEMSRSDVLKVLVLDKTEANTELKKEKALCQNFLGHVERLRMQIIFYFTTKNSGKRENIWKTEWKIF